MKEITLEEVQDRMPGAIRVIHKICGGIAFWYGDIPRGSTVVLDPRKAMLVDGRRVREGDPVICGRCEEPVGVQHMEFCIDEGRLH